ncbi:MAG TPA: chromate transporter [Candidatus Izemoplasmatales bacterium]|nr:chromate transporter [Candidatus Izemoplasmatales bacterium]
MYLTLFWTFFKIGLFTFGGGYAMIPFIHRFGVDKYQWVSEEEFLDIITIAESTPGPIAVNSATYIGYKVKGIKGSIAANIGLAIPSIVIIILIAIFFMQFQENKHVMFAFKGIRVGVSVLIINAAIRMYRKLNKNLLSYALIMVGFFLLLFDLLPVIYVIIIGGIIGIIIQLMKARGVHNGTAS